MEAFIPSTSTRSTGSCPRYSQASLKTVSHKCILGLPWGLLLVGHAWNASWGSHLKWCLWTWRSGGCSWERSFQSASFFRPWPKARAHRSGSERTFASWLIYSLPRTVASLRPWPQSTCQCKSKWRDPTNALSTLLQDEMQGLLGLLSAMLLTWWHRVTPMIILSAVQPRYWRPNTKWIITLSSWNGGALLRSPMCTSSVMDQVNFRSSILVTLSNVLRPSRRWFGCPTQHCGVNCLLAATVETLEDWRVPPKVSNSKVKFLKGARSEKIQPVTHFN